MPVLILKESVARRTTRGLTALVTLPPNVYRPSFKDQAGIYYHPDTPMVILGQPSPRSYVFVSYADAKKQAYWLEGYAVLDWFESPIPFEQTSGK